MKNLPTDTVTFLFTDIFTYVIPDMVGRYVRSGDLEASIKWGMGQIKYIYSKHKS